MDFQKGKDMKFVAVFLLGMAGSAFAAEHHKLPIGHEHAVECRKKNGLESKFQVYFEAHRSVEDRF